jgi:hypothetical protein
VELLSLCELTVFPIFFMVEAHNGYLFSSKDVSKLLSFHKLRLKTETDSKLVYVEDLRRMHIQKILTFA